MFWVIQRTPDPFAITSMDRQTVRVATPDDSYLQATVGSAQTGTYWLTVQPQFADFIAQIDFRLHIHNRVTSPHNYEFVGTCRARRVKQCING